MRIKRMICGIVACVCMIVILPESYAYADAGELLFDMDFTDRRIDEKPSNVYTTNIPKYGRMGFGYKADGKTTSLICEDSSEIGGIEASFAIPELSGRFTLYSKFTFGNVAMMDFYDGIKASFQNNGFRIYKGASKLYLYNNTAEQISPFSKLVFNAGNEIEMWACVDTNKKVADLYLKADVLKRYNSAMIDGATLENGLFCLRNLKINADRITTVKLTTKTGVGKNYIDCIRAYNGFVRPDAKNDAHGAGQSGNKSNKVIMPIKAPWLTRLETKDYLSGGIKTILSTANYKKNDLEIKTVTGEAYMPSLKKIDKTLETLRGVHPRILFDAEGLEAYKTKFSDPDYSMVTKGLLKTWEGLLDDELFVYDASLSNGKFRVVGDTMQSLALAYKVTGDRRYFERTLEWIEIANTMPQYGDGRGIAASHILYGLGITYDLLYDELSNDTKEGMKRAMLEHGAYLWQAWKGDIGYLHNFGYTIICAFAAVPLALFDESGCEQVVDWLYGSQEHIARSLEVMSPDGCSPEGTGYFGYGINYLTRYLFISEKWGFDPWSCESLINLMRKFRVYISFPRNTWTGHDHLAQFGDSYGYDFNSLISTMYYVAGHGENCETVVWMANELLENGCSEVDELTPLFYDKTMEARPPGENGYPTMGYLKDFGYVFTRSDWSGDESAIYFQCGFNGGEHALPYLRSYPDEADFGFGHNEPAANHFLLYNKGDQLLCTDSYSYKLTSQHNTLIVNGRGQIGDDQVWYKSPLVLEGIDWTPPYVKKAVSYDDYDYFVGAGANAYPKSLGVEKYNRHMLYIKPNALVVIDDIRTKQASDLELRFFSGTDAVYPAGKGFIANGSNTDMYVENLTPEQTSMTVQKNGVYINRNPANQRGFTCYTAKAHDNAIVNVTAFTWCDKGGIPSKIEMKQEGDSYTFAVDGKEYTVNIRDLSSNKEDAYASEKNRENKLEALNVANIPIELKDGIYDYSFDLDDYYLTARKENVSIFAIDEEHKSENVTVMMPIQLPGKAKITVKSDDDEKVYTVDISKTNLTDVEKVEMTPLSDKNPFSNSWVPSNLLDGALSTGWRTCTVENHPIFDMGEITEICGFDIGWMKNMDDGFDVILKVSNDGESFVEAYRTQADTSDNVVKYFEIPGGIKARYVELIIDTRVDNFSYEMSEFGLYKRA